MDQTLNATELADEYRKMGSEYKDVWAKIQEKVFVTHPIHLGIGITFQYDSKSDRYTLVTIEHKFKVVAESVQYYMEQYAKRNRKPSVYGHMDKGTIDGLTLLFD